MFPKEFLIESQYLHKFNKLPISKKAEPVKGWKRIDIDNRPVPGLYSAFNNDCKLKPEMEAKCNYYNHWPPQPGCSCGFYAYKDKDDVAYCDVVVEVELYGVVISHMLGYRAQYQRIICVWCKDEAMARRVRELGFEAKVQKGRPKYPMSMF